MSKAALGIPLRSRKPVNTSAYHPLGERTVARTTGITAHGLAVRRPAAGTAPALSIEVHRALDGVARTWQDFEARATTTLYQSYPWCRAWLETCGAALGVSACVVLVRDATGQLLAILPFQIRRRAGLRILEWLGTPHAGYGYGLFAAESIRHAGDWAPEAFARGLDAVGGFDVAILTDMPEQLGGAAHPLRSIFNIRSANVSFQMALDSDFEALHARKRDREDRRAARKKEANLAAAGVVNFGLPGPGPALHRSLDELFDLHAARMAELGVRGVATPPERAFLHRLAELHDGGPPILLPYRLSCGDETLAVMLGGQHGGTFWALISALATGPTRKQSPGDLALRKTIRACCESGLKTIDFSAGDSRYKRAWADTEIGLHHHVSARNLMGLAFAAAVASRITIKRLVKTSPALFGLATDIRRRLFGR